MKPTLDLSCGLLRPTCTEDLAFVSQLLTAAPVRRFLCDNVILSETDVASMLADSDKLDADGLGHWIIVAESWGAAGLVGLAPVSGPLAALPETSSGIEPVIALAPEHFSKGLAFAAMSAALKYACEDLRLKGLVAAVDVPNEASHRLMAATGFERYGRTPGERGDLIVYKISFTGRAAS